MAQVYLSPEPCVVLSWLELENIISYQFHCLKFIDAVNEKLFEKKFFDNCRRRFYFFYFYFFIYQGVRLVRGPFCPSKLRRFRASSNLSLNSIEYNDRTTEKLIKVLTSLLSQTERQSSELADSRLNSKISSWENASTRSRSMTLKKPC